MKKTMWMMALIAMAVSAVVLADDDQNDPAAGTLPGATLNCSVKNDQGGTEAAGSIATVSRLVPASHGYPAYITHRSDYLTIRFAWGNAASGYTNYIVKAYTVGTMSLTVSEEATGKKFGTATGFGSNANYVILQDLPAPLNGLTFSCVI